MPKIPEGRFNKTPSVRVGAQRVPTPQVSGVDRALKATQEITNAMAKIADQRERTEAYNAANDVKRGYEQKKAQYLLNLDAAGADGNYEYANPMSEDPTKPEIIKGNINEDLQGLNDYFTESQENLQGLERFDIASDLNQQYVGDDLNLLRMKTGKNIVRKQQKLQTDNLLKNMEGGMLKVLDLSANASPAVLDASVAATLNQIDREIATVTPSIGRENAAKAMEFKDRILQNTASEALSRNMSHSSVTVADKLVSKIKDPMARSNATFKMEGIKKTQAAKADKLIAQDVRNISNELLTTDHAGPELMLKAKEAAEKARNSYYDPKYSKLDLEQRDTLVLRLDAAILSKHTIQEQIDMPEEIALVDNLMEVQKRMEDATGAGRSPDANDVAALNEANKKLDDFLERSMASSGLKGMGGKRKLELFDLAKKDLAKLYTNLDKQIPSMIRRKYPDKDNRWVYNEIDMSAQTMKLGDPQYVPTESINAFRRDMKVDLKKDAKIAIDTWTRAMHGAGEDHARAVMMDLAKGDKKLEFLIPAADLHATGNSALAAKMIRDASLVDTTEEIVADTKSGKLTSGDIENAFRKNLTPGIQLAVQNNAVMSGIKTAIQNRAKAIMIKTGETDTGDAMKKAFEEFGQYYTIRKSDDERHVVMATKSKNGIDFTTDEAKRALDIGVNHAVVNMPGVSLEDKRALARDYLKLPSWKVLNEKDLGLYFKENFSIQPSSRDINKHRIIWEGDNIILPDGRILEYSAEDFYEYGINPVLKSESPRLQI
jgi:hypothetical protein